VPEGEESPTAQPEKVIKFGGLKMNKQLFIINIETEIENLQALKNENSIDESNLQFSYLKGYMRALWEADILTTEDKEKYLELSLEAYRRV